VTLFESAEAPPPRDDSWRWADDPFSRLRREHRRKRVVAASSIAALVCAVLFGVVLAIGPERVATTTAELFGAAAPPPAADLVAVADRTYLTEEGRALLFASKPRIASLAEVAAACERPIDDPPAGCFSSLGGISVYQPADARVADSAVTTLAHELLHAAWEKLGIGERVRVGELLEAEVARVPADDPVLSSIEWSIGDHASSRQTELFAYLGSSVQLDGGFAPELETLYARWFTDRAALVALARRMESTVDSVYSEAVAAIEGLTAQEQANANERAQLEADRAAHEAARVRYNADADQYNALPAEERSRWMATWTDADGQTRTAPLEESLRVRLVQLDEYRAALDTRTAALAAAEASAIDRRAAAEAQRADLLALLAAAYPGQAFE
jgi:hypothetical protein